MTDHSHTALARRYRPRSFAEVSAQAHVSETLRGAVAGGRVGHAYLFCGPRGVGKTTIARVLAMALNCPDRTEAGEPCGVCESCTRIWSGHTSLDVVEIDAASNRGVDDARSLRERAMYAPSAEDRFKVYIVDEAHMLTREAWNALLKILEEPPPRVIFVFATTEPQKIQQAATPILSRCQRFDFRSIGGRDIVDRLEDVVEREGVGAEADALRAIARRADGGMRDALSLTDQVLSLTGGELTLDAVRTVLGLVEEERYLELFGVLAAGRHGEIFRVVERLAADGYDLVEFYHGLVSALRVLLRMRLGEDAGVLDVPEHLEAAFREQAESFGTGDLVRMLSMAADLEANGNLRRTPNPRVLIEMLLLRMSYLERTARVEELLSDLGGPPASPRPRPEMGPREGPGREDPATASSSSSASTVPSALPSTPPSAPLSALPDVSGEAPSEASSRVVSPAAPPIAPAPPPTGTPQQDQQGTRRALAERVLGPTEAWNAFLEAGQGVPPGLGPFLRLATVRAADPESAGAGSRRLVVELPDGPGLERMASPAVQAAVAAGLAPFLGTAPSLEVRKSGADSDGAPEDSPPVRVTQETVRETRLQELIEREPLLEQAVEVLDLELME